MDILYIHPAKQEVDATTNLLLRRYPFMPVGVVGLMNLLRSDGWQVAGLNLPVNLSSSRRLICAWLTKERPPSS